MGNINIHTLRKPPRALLVGLNSSGKTALLYRITEQLFPHTIPTIGINVEKLKFPSVEVAIWDVGGQVNQRILWPQCYSGISAIIFVVDASDIDRMKDSRDELEKMLQHPSASSVPVLVLANKQDVEDALSPVDVAESLNLGLLMAGRAWNVIGTSASDGQGINSVISWISLRIRPSHSFLLRNKRKYKQQNRSTTTSMFLSTTSVSTTTTTRNSGGGQKNNNNNNPNNNNNFFSTISSSSSSKNNWTQIGPDKNNLTTTQDKYNINDRITAVPMGTINLNDNGSGVLTLLTASASGSPTSPTSPTLTPCNLNNLVINQEFDPSALNHVSPPKSPVSPTSPMSPPEGFAAPTLMSHHHHNNRSFQRLPSVKEEDDNRLMKRSFSHSKITMSNSSSRRSSLELALEHRTSKEIMMQQMEMEMDEGAEERSNLMEEEEEEEEDANDDEMEEEEDEDAEEEDYIEEEDINMNNNNNNNEEDDEEEDFCSESDRVTTSFSLDSDEETDNEQADEWAFEVQQTQRRMYAYVAQAVN